MYLRNGKLYHNPGSIDNIIKLQSYFRGRIVHNEFQPYLKSIKMIRKRFPHLKIDGSNNRTSLVNKVLKSSHTKSSKKPKKKTKKSKVKKINTLDTDEDNNNTYINDDEYIVSQYNSIKNMGSNVINGIKRSTRANKGKQPDRYVDENFIEIILEDSKIEEVLESGSDVETDYHSDDDFSNDDSDGEWDENYESSSEDECSEDDV